MAGVRCWWCFFGNCSVHAGLSSLWGLFQCVHLSVLLVVLVCVSQGQFVCVSCACNRVLHAILCVCFLFMAMSNACGFLLPCV